MLVTCQAQLRLVRSLGHKQNCLWQLPYSVLGCCQGQRAALVLLGLLHRFSILVRCTLQCLRGLVSYYVSYD